MDFDVENTAYIATLSVIIAAAALKLIAVVQQPHPKRWWVRPWILKRNERGTFRLINEEFDDCEDPQSFINFVRMDKTTFDKLLGFVKNDIEKQSTLMRNSISAKNRLIITLRFLATGESFQSLQYTFRIGKTTIASIVIEVCNAIYKNLKASYLKVPATAAEWLNIANGFYKNWNFPNTMGALDGKHILFRAPLSEGSVFYNYKDQNSIILLAVADSTYKFIYVDCGTNGQVSDGGVFAKSTLAAAIENGILNLPEEQALPGRINKVPFVFVADAAFPLKRNILKPFPFRNMIGPQRVFNYRLSRARRVVENAFGIFANRWRIFLTTINLSPEKVQQITLACCALHNFLLTESPLNKGASLDDSDNFSFKFGLTQQQGNRCGQEAINVRNEFMEYVMNEGAVIWQNNYA